MVLKMLLTFIIVDIMIFPIKFLLWKSIFKDYFAQKNKS